MKRLALGLSLLAAATPAAAVETLYLQGPLGRQRLSVNLQELSSPEALWSGSSDLAELNRATDGRLGRSLQTLLTTPLPLPVQLGLDNPMARQVEMLVQSLVEPSERQWQLPVVQAGASLPWLRQAAASGEPLTDRQYEVLFGMATGKTNLQIAKEQNLSESAIKQETVKIYRSLGVKTRQQAVGKAKALGLLPPDLKIVF